MKITTIGAVLLSLCLTANASITNSVLTIDLSNKTVSVSATIAIRETINVALVNIGTSDPTKLVLRVVRETNAYACATNFVSAGTDTNGNVSAVGPLSLNTTELVDYYEGFNPTASMEWSLGVWDTSLGRLLVNDYIDIQNNPYDESMPAPSPVGVVYVNTNDAIYLNAATGFTYRTSGNTGTVSKTGRNVVITFPDPSSATGAVTTVNGKDGAVVLTTTDIGEGTNLYYTAARVSAHSAIAGQVITNSYFQGLHTAQAGTNALFQGLFDALSSTNSLFQSLFNSQSSTNGLFQSIFNSLLGTNSYFQGLFDSQSSTNAGFETRITENNTGKVSLITYNAHVAAQENTNSFFQSLFDSFSGSNSLFQSLFNSQANTNTGFQSLHDSQVSTNSLFQSLFDALTGTNSLFQGLFDSQINTNAGFQALHTAQAVTNAAFESRIQDGETAYAWGDHAAAGYLTTGTNLFNGLYSANRSVLGTNLSGLTQGTYTGSLTSVSYTGVTALALGKTYAWGFTKQNAFGTSTLSIASFSLTKTASGAISNYFIFKGTDTNLVLRLDGDGSSKSDVTGVYVRQITNGDINVAGDLNIGGVMNVDGALMVNPSAHIASTGTNVHGLGTAALRADDYFDLAGAAGAVQTNLNTASNVLNTAVTTEVARATGQESVLQNNITNEYSRATNMEFVLQGNINSASNVAVNAQNFANSVSNLLVDETSARTNSEYLQGLTNADFETRKVNTNDVTYTATVAKAASALQTEVDPVWTGKSNAVVYTNDSRLTDSRNPLAHTQGYTTITDAPWISTVGTISHTNLTDPNGSTDIQHLSAAEKAIATNPPSTNGLASTNWVAGQGYITGETLWPAASNQVQSELSGLNSRSNTWDGGTVTALAANATANGLNARSSIWDSAASLGMTNLANQYAATGTASFANNTLTIIHGTNTGGGAGIDTNTSYIYANGTTQSVASMIVRSKLYMTNSASTNIPVEFVPMVGAPIDGNIYGRRNEGWFNVDNKLQKISWVRVTTNLVVTNNTVSGYEGIYTQSKFWTGSEGLGEWSSTNGYTIWKQTAGYYTLGDISKMNFEEYSPIGKYEDDTTAVFGYANWGAVVTNYATGRAGFDSTTGVFEVDGEANLARMYATSNVFAKPIYGNGAGLTNIPGVLTTAEKAIATNAVQTGGAGSLASLQITGGNPTNGSVFMATNSLGQGKWTRKLTKAIYLETQTTNVLPITVTGVGFRPSGMSVMASGGLGASQAHIDGNGQGSINIYRSYLSGWYGALGLSIYCAYILPSNNSELWRMSWASYTDDGATFTCDKGNPTTNTVSLMFLFFP
jgi:hypothetical protein